MLSSVLKTYTPPQGPLAILYQDNHLIVLDKPSGLLSVPGKGEHLADCLSVRVEKEFPDALMVHRLDMDTSGVFLMARNPEAQSNLGKQFERRKVQKSYIADIWGLPETESGYIDLPLRCDWPNRPLQMVCHDHGKPSQTEWEILERYDNSARLKLTPITGRSHQLRVHLKEIGHPILGDPFYAQGDALKAAPRLLLHAHILTIHHPENGELITFTSPCPF